MAYTQKLTFLDKKIWSDALLKQASRNRLVCLSIKVMSGNKIKQKLIRSLIVVTYKESCDSTLFGTLGHWMSHWQTSGLDDQIFR